MKIIKLSILLLLSVFIISGCESVEEAQNAADEFFEAYNNEDEAKMESLLDQESVIDAGIKGDFYNVFDQQWQAYGKVIDYERYGFQTNTNNGLTTVVLRFNADTETGGKIYIKLRFVKRSDGYKVFVYEYNTSKSVIDKPEE